MDTSGLKGKKGFGKGGFGHFPKERKVKEKERKEVNLEKGKERVPV